MANAWDYISKRLVRAHARHFTKWLLKEATFIRQLDNQLQIQSLYADALLEVELHGKRGLLHIEFQSYYDATMALRTLEYNVMASRQYDHTRVYSVVIYLRDKGGVPTSPYVRDFIDERPVHLFFYNVIKLWEIPAESIFQSESHGTSAAHSLDRERQTTGTCPGHDRPAGSAKRNGLAINLKHYWYASIHASR